MFRNYYPDQGKNGASKPEDKRGKVLDGKTKMLLYNLPLEGKSLPYMDERLKFFQRLPFVKSAVNSGCTNYIPECLTRL